MQKWIVCSTVLALATLFWADFSAADVSIDWEVCNQTIVGFGGTMGWIHPSDENFEKIADMLFKDLGVSVLRIHALGAETGDEDSAEPRNDNNDPNVFSWDGFLFKETEKRNAKIIKAALDRGVKTVIATSWSPPAWMKDSDSRIGGSFKKQEIREFAELWAAYLVSMKVNWGVEIPYVSIQNEPDLAYNYPTCKFDPDTYALTVESVQKRIRSEGLKTEVVGPDICRAYNLKSYRDSLSAVGYKGPLLIHLYDLSIPFQDVEKDPPRWKDARNDAGKQPLWFMETANYLSGNVVAPGSYEEALIWAQKMHYALVEGNCAAVLYWALYFDKVGEALIFASASDARSYTVTPKYYTSMHYFKYIRPGMVRVAVAGAPNGLLVSAFHTPEDDLRVIVAINTDKKPAEVKVLSTGYTWECVATNEKDFVKSSALAPGTEACQTPARGIMTLVGKSMDKRSSAPAADPISHLFQ